MGRRKETSTCNAVRICFMDEERHDKQVNSFFEWPSTRLQEKYNDDEVSERLQYLNLTKPHRPELTHTRLESVVGVIQIPTLIKADVRLRRTDCRLRSGAYVF